MLFTEARFFVFFAVVWGLTWSLRSNRARRILLLASSYAFYAGWDWRFLGLIGASTLTDWIVARRLEVTVAPAVRKAWLGVSLSLNLGLLGFFKYFGFFVESAAHFADWLGLGLGVPELAIVLPVGISFYTFQTMGYSLDVYHRRIAPADNLLDFALFVGFFPQLVAGPVVRAQELLPQFKVRQTFASVPVRAMLVLFLVGYFKKAVVADSLAPIVATIAAAPHHYDAAAIWFAQLFFTVQIYCDFSGYSDMAIALAGLLGYRLPVNFRQPLLATSLSKLWARWHITLTRWIGDYIYRPLGGSKDGPWRTARNVVVTMTLIGLWHGAAWQFIVFGALHGLAMVVERFVRGSRIVNALPKAIVAGLGWFTAVWWFVACIGFFQGDSLAGGVELFTASLTFQSTGTEAIALHGLWWLLPFGIVEWLSFRGVFDRLWRALPAWAFPAIYGGCWSITLALVPTTTQDFFYFQF